MSKISAEDPFRKISSFYYKQNICLLQPKLFWYERTEGTAPYISLKIPERFSRIIFQGSSEWLHVEVP